MRGLAVMLAACGAPKTTVFIPNPPTHPQAASLVFVIEGESPLLYAVNLPWAGPLEEMTSWRDPGPFTAFGFFYPRRLDAYGVLEGAVPPASDGSRSCALSSPSAVLRFDSGGSEWSPAGDAPLERIVDGDAYGCRAEDLCLSFESRALDLDSIETAVVVIPLDAERALVASIDQHFYEIDASGVRARTELAGLPADSGAMTDDGEIWLGGRGRLARGALGGELSTETIGSTDERIGAIAPRGTGADVEVLILSIEKLEDVATSTVRVRLHAGGTLSLIHQSVVTRATWRQSGIAWSPSGEAVISLGGRTALVYANDAIEALPLMPAIALLEPDLNAVMFSPSLGHLIGGGDGFVYRLGPGERVIEDIIPDVTLGNKIQGLGPAYDGFMFGGPDGKMGQFHPSGAPCDASKLAMSDVERIVQIGGAILVTGGNPDRSRSNTVTWLIPTR